MSVITSVWSTFGHRFYGTGGYEDEAMTRSYEQCITCGAGYILTPRPDDDTSGDYVARNGDDPAECTGLTDLVHGEAPCDADNGHGCEASQEGPCQHEATEHGCNCLLCTG